MTSVMGIKPRDGEVIKAVNAGEPIIRGTDISDEMMVQHVEAIEAEAQGSGVCNGIGVKEIDDVFLEDLEAIEAEILYGRRDGERNKKNIEIFGEEESEDNTESSEGSYWGRPGQKNR